MRKWGRHGYSNCASDYDKIIKIGSCVWQKVKQNGRGEKAQEYCELAPNNFINIAHEKSGHHTKWNRVYRKQTCLHSHLIFIYVKHMLLRKHESQLRIHVNTDNNGCHWQYRDNKKLGEAELPLNSDATKCLTLECFVVIIRITAVLYRKAWLFICLVSIIVSGEGKLHILVRIDVIRFRALTQQVVFLLLFDRFSGVLFTETFLWCKFLVHLIIK